MRSNNSYSLCRGWSRHAAAISRKALTPGMLPRNGGLYISRALADDSIAEGGQNFTLQCEDAKAMLDSKTCVFVDMRSEKAYDYEHITKPPRMTVNIPYHEGGDIEDYAALIQRRYSNTNTGLLLVCEDGDIGIATADILQGKGYAKVYGVEGGYQGWMQKFTTSGRRRIGGKFVSSGKEHEIWIEPGFRGRFHQTNNERKKKSDLGEPDMTLALVFRGAVQRFLENMGIAYSNELSPITIVSLGIFGVSVCVLLLQTVLFGIILPIRRQVGKLFSTGEQDSLETLNTKSHSKTTQKNNTSSKAKNTKKKKKKTNSSTTTTSRKQEDNNKESEANSEQQQQHGVSLKALKRMEKEIKKSDAASGMKQHESNLFLETINSKHHTDEVTGFSENKGGTWQRIIREESAELVPGGASHCQRYPDTIGGVFDVVCLEVEEQGKAMLVAFITYGPYTTVEVHTARISLDPKDPSMDILDKAPKIFAPKIDFDPLLLTGSSTRLVAASKKPRVAALDVANESLQSLKNIDTNSIVNNDVAVSPDGSIVCVATFSSDVPCLRCQKEKSSLACRGIRSE
eukprot:jgi/Picre1/35838/NNA_003298.t1